MTKIDIDMWKPMFPKIPRLFCKCGNKGLDVKWRRKNTAFENDKSNWMCSCKECYQETYDYYEERWADYYAGLL